MTFLRFNAWTENDLNVLREIVKDRPHLGRKDLTAAYNLRAQVVRSSSAVSQKAAQLLDRRALSQPCHLRPLSLLTSLMSSQLISNADPPAGGPCASRRKQQAPRPATASPSNKPSQYCTTLRRTSSTRATLARMRPLVRTRSSPRFPTRVTTRNRIRRSGPTKSEGECLG